MNGEQCSNCRFFRRFPEPSASMGCCRRYPPSAESHADRPTVGIHQWCGEWQAESNCSAAIHADWLEGQGCPKEWTDKLRKGL